MSAYLHAGSGKSVRRKEIIGLFDIDGTTSTGVTRAFLAASQKRGEVINISEEIPRSFLLCTEGRKAGKYSERKPSVVVSPLSVTTLKDRLKRKI